MKPPQKNKDDIPKQCSDESYNTAVENAYCSSQVVVQQHECSEIKFSSVSPSVSRQRSRHAGKETQAEKNKASKSTVIIELDGTTYKYHNLQSMKLIKNIIPEIDYKSAKDMTALKYPRSAKIYNADDPDTYYKPCNIPFNILVDPEDTYSERMRGADYKSNVYSFKDGRPVTIPNESLTSFNYCKAIFRKVWNQYKPDIPDIVTGIYIGGLEKSEPEIMGAYNKINKTLHYHTLVLGSAADDDELLEIQIGKTINHEIAHVEWFNYPKRVQKKLEDKFSVIEPSNAYVKIYYDEWQVLQKKHDDIVKRFGDVSTYDAQSKKSMMKFIKKLKWRKNLYANEQHSEMIAILRTGHLPADKKDLRTYRKLLKSFESVMNNKACVKQLHTQKETQT